MKLAVILAVILVELAVAMAFLADDQVEVACAARACTRGVARGRADVAASLPDAGAAPSKSRSANAGSLR